MNLPDHKVMERIPGRFMGFALNQVVKMAKKHGFSKGTFCGRKIKRSKPLKHANHSRAVQVLSRPRTTWATKKASE